MSDVIIKGMEMPKGCYSCPIGNHIGLYAVQCPITKSKIDGCTEIIRLSDCPLRPAPEWISVEERLPTEEWRNRPHNTDIWPCMVYRKAFNYPDKKYVTKAYFDGECFVDLENTVLDRHVTHWVPLPEPPKEETT